MQWEIGAGKRKTLEAIECEKTLNVAEFVCVWLFVCFKVCAFFCVFVSATGIHQMLSAFHAESKEKLRRNWKY